MSDTVADVAGEVAALRDLFKRRLEDDRAKQRLYDELYAQLEFSRKGLIEQALQPLLREELLVMDRLERYRGSDPDFAHSLWAELKEILARRGVTEVDVTSTFDPATQEAVEGRPGPADAVGRVVAVRRRGYWLGEQLLRPAQVIIGEAEQPEREETVEEGSLEDRPES